MKYTKLIRNLKVLSQRKKEDIDIDEVGNESVRFSPLVDVCNATGFFAYFRSTAGRRKSDSV